MGSIEASGSIAEIYPELKSINKKLIGNLIVVIPNDINIQKKINKIENKFKDQIVSKNQYFQDKNVIIFIIFEGIIQNFHKIVVDINSIKEVKNFRYLIIN